MSEIWLPVAGFEGAYEVSDMGRVRSVDRIVFVVGRWGTKERRRYRGKLIQPSVSKRSPYARVVLSKQGVVSGHTVHTLMLEAFVGPCPAGQEARHLDCNSANNTLGNLGYGTRIANREDSRLMDTLAVGERIAQHKLTETEVRKIRQSTTTTDVLAFVFGVSKRQIRRIRNREAWRHVI